jgi:hypothetical protein
MDQQQWAVLRDVAGSVTRSFGKLPRAVFSDQLIVLLFFWAVLHDRPMTWSLKRCHYNRMFRPRKLPSISQLNRRIASDRFQHILQRIHERLVGDVRFKGLIIDGKPLCVSPVSGDRDARVGHISGGFGKGYKLHAVTSSDGKIPVFCVLSLNVHEMAVARHMLTCLPDLTGVLVMADGNYDSHVLHKDVSVRGAWLITNPRGNAEHPVTLRQMGPARRLLLKLWKKSPELMQAMYHHRDAVERRFGNLSNLLGPLPNFVRGLARVRRWAGAKICLYHALREAKLMEKAVP